MAADTRLFDEKFIGKVSRLKLAISKKTALSYQGRRRSALKGSSAEFSDYREYVPGDDIRRIDWNVYARLDRPFVREYMEERESAVNIFLDMSMSMSVDDKRLLAKKLAGALGLISLSNLDRLSFFVIYEGRVDNIRFAGGKNNIRRALDIIEGITPSGNADIISAVKSVPYLPHGLSVLISDFMDEKFLEQGDSLCKYLSYRGQEIVFLHVMSESELRPQLSGSYIFTDMENAYSPVRLTLDEKTFKSYENELGVFLSGVRKIARNGNAKYFLLDTAVSFDQMIFYDLRSIYDV